jgi:hypothetical protein
MDAVTQLLVESDICERGKERVRGTAECFPRQVSGQWQPRQAKGSDEKETSSLLPFTIFQ